jgi:broad specificity phosphatase PhoE
MTRPEEVLAAGPRVRALGARVTRELGVGGAILALRHSIRDPIRSADLAEAMAAPLTEAGRELAATLAEELPVRLPIRLRHSPVPRCEETAQILAARLAARGAEARLLGPLVSLGAVYVRDPDRVVERFAALGQRGFVRDWSSGGFPASVVEPPRVAGERLLHELLALHRAEPPGLDLHVTHDLTLVALLSLVEAVGERDFPWPDYLDGILLLREGDGGVRWHHGDAVHLSHD